MREKILFVLCATFLLCACGGEKKQPLVFYDTYEGLEDTDSIETDDTFSSYYGEQEDTQEGDVISVPFEESGGVKLVKVKINNGFSVDMILDSGCSGTLISIAEARYLYEKGYFTADDILGTAQSQIADGSIVENMVINLKQLEIGGQIICPNVQATVSANTKAPLLLGNEVLNRTASYSVDNVNKVINFTLK